MHNKVVVVTGASSGIGEALTRRLAAEGATVVAAARRRDRLESLAEEIRISGAVAPLIVPCDVTVREEAEHLIHYAARHSGRLDVLVNNAGRGHLSSVEETTDETIHDMFALNVFALWHTTRPALGYMRRQGSGHIINIASIAGKIGFPFNSAYVAAKHACVGFTHALRLELIETGIHASVVCPAGVKSPWAEVTQGGSMKALFSASGAAVKRIAADRGISLPSMEGAIPPDNVAAAIVECIRHPVPEVYTHRGSFEFALLAARDLEAAEHQQLPVVLGEREAYKYLRGTKPAG